MYLKPLFFLIASVASVSHLLANAAYYNVSPLKIELTPKKRQEWISVQAGTSMSQPIALEFQLLRREQEPSSGAPIHKEDLLDLDPPSFWVQPNKLILFPGESQMVDLRYLVPAEVEKERVYTLRVRQVALPSLKTREGTKTSKSPQLSLEYLINYEGAVYVAPVRPHPKVEVIGLRSDGSKTKLTLELINKGTGKQILDEPFQLILTDTRQKQHTLCIDPKQIGHHQYAIYPDSVRIIDLPYPQELVDPIAQVQVSFKGAARFEAP